MAGPDNGVSSSQTAGVRRNGQLRGAERLNSRAR
jgi:hypothetical protein